MGRALAECMFHGKVHIFEQASGEVPERCKITGKARSSLTPPESATRSERFLILTEVPPVPARVYRFLAGFVSFSNRPGYFYLLFLNVTEA